MNIDAELEKARALIFSRIDVMAMKQKIWLIAAGESLSRSFGQKWRHAKGKK